MQLPGPWRAHVADDDLRRVYAEPDFDDDDWHEVPVPGHWQSSEAFRDNQDPLFYRTGFSTHPAEDDQRYWLRFAGIFYDADVFLDGGYLGATSGYFFPHAFEITDQVHSQTEHELAIEIGCHKQRDLQQKRNLTGAFQHSSHLDLNKNPGGIWRPVTFEKTGPVAIRFFRVICTDCTEREATLSIRAVVDTAIAREVRFQTSVVDVNHELVQPLAAGENRVEWTVTVDNPERWWPHSLGAQPLHDVEVGLVIDATSNDGVPSDRVSDSRSVRTGFRSVSVDDWVHRINGERLFLKGANLGPTRTFIADASVEEIVGDLHAAKEAGLDFFRVHTHISRPELYEAADELGILLWQDFPMHQGYDRSVRGQAGSQAREMVDLLGHHPSIFTWCGHNEPDGRDDSVPAPSLVKSNRPGWNRTVLDRTIKRAIGKNDPSRPIIAHSGVAPHLPRLDGTDSHLWFGWHGQGNAADLAEAAARMPRLVRFVSEFGAQSVPLDAEFCSPAQWPRLDWDTLERHHGLSRDVLARRVPPSMFETFDEWAEATRRYQASVVKIQIETLRRLKYRPTGGFSVHHLADGQPAISTSLLGHDRRPKPAFAAVTDACRPVIVTADPIPYAPLPGSVVHLGVHVVSDLRNDGTGVVHATLTDPTGTREWHWEGDIGADAVTRVGEVVWTVPSGGGEVTLDLELIGDGLTATNRYVATL